MSTDLPFTGERFVPGDPAAAGEMWTEHWHRYHFVRPWVTGKRVLDVACGEGYGSALMARAAQTVTGVDISSAAIAHARSAYAARGNVEFIESSCTALPFEPAAFDCVVSFETLEHIADQAAFMAEVRRVLKPDGVFIVSTPNKAEYSDRRGFSNPYHVKELYRAEFEALLAQHFAHRRWLSQRNAFVSLIEDEGGATVAEALVASKAAPEDAGLRMPALYSLVVAANDATAVARLPFRLSVFTDAEEWAVNDHRKLYRDCQYFAQRERDLMAEVERLRAAGTAASQAPAPSSEAGVPADSAIARFIKKLST
ncbi:MAG: class I SAM-dependent methyltransferase [Betaproteobacteria bacterium]|nr:class I SAM-dependent methyltransferase [Betaproteobacteria bacterium]